MRNWLKRFFQRRPPLPAEGRVLELERQTQSLRLELQQRDQALEKLKKQVERLREGENTRVNDAVQSHIEPLMSDVAPPVAQLNTQAHLVEVENKTVQARDVLAVARQIVHSLEDKGLSLEGTVGQSVPYDPDRHSPLGAGDLNPGDQVVVRFVSVTYRDRVVYKAGVEKA